MRQLLVEQEKGKTSIALLQDRLLMDYWNFEEETIAAEHIYLAVVDRVAKGISAVFVKLTETQNGFLPFSELKAPVKSGDTILVQVKKPPVQSKNAYVSQDISLAGDNLVLLPMSEFCAVSKRVQDKVKKEKMLSVAKQLAPKGMGVVMRSRCEYENVVELEIRIQTLQKRWNTILEKSKTIKAPALIDGGLSPLAQTLRDNDQIEMVTVTNERLVQGVDCKYFVHHAPFALFNVQHQLAKACAKRIWLPCGGFLVVDQCEAMTVIDVNTGKYEGKKEGNAQTFFHLNKEAVKEIARIMRLRSFGGIIIVDFIDMKEEEHQQAVRKLMEETLRKDPVKCVVHGFTALGLLEMTRKKTMESYQTISNSYLCTHCKGTGIRQEEI